MKTELEKNYKNTTLRIGITLLFFLTILYINFLTLEYVNMYVFDKWDETKSEVTYQLIYGGAYLLSFMLPVAFYRLISRGKPTQKIKFEPSVPKYLILWILAGVGCVTALAFINSSVLESFFSVPDAMTIEPSSTVQPNYVIVLEYIVTALVPAFCEEFLFRGMVLTNLLPYGKTTAIIGSAVLFSLMHQNPWQLLYTFGAGIIMGVVYVYSGSIWPSVLMHLTNNQLSVIASVFYNKFDEQTATALYYLLETLTIFAGLLSAVFLAVKLSKQKTDDLRQTGAVGRELAYNDDTSKLNVKETVAGFFSPTVIIFTAVSVAMWIIILIMPV